MYTRSKRNKRILINSISKKRSGIINKYSNENTLGTAQQRVNIPKAVREQLWETECIVIKGYKTLSKICPVCNRETEKKHCHLAHKVSLFNGGSNHTHNLFYICSQCNQSMGTMNSEDYISNYYSM